MIFETHCHLNSPELYSDLTNVINKALDAGVKKMLVVGYDYQTSLLAVDLASQYDFIYAAIGFHPTEIDNVSKADFDKMFSLLSHQKVVAIGEIGLDYYWIKDLAKQQKQKQFFIKQIQLANKFKLPIVVHNREATHDCLDILKQHTPIYGGVMHCFSSSYDMAKEFIKLGMYISLGGPVTFLNAKQPKDVAAKIPLEKLLVETDSPYLSPHPLRGKRNEPANIVFVINMIAELKNTSAKQISEATYQNACKLFHV